ncbi:MAG: GxxExxY protein [Caldilineales bacterium]|nr:GxxExxY protein [Caldilineales bacterium]
MLHGDLTDAILGAFYDVYNTMGYGFLEKVYENALVHELRKRGMTVEQQAPLPVYYDGVQVGEYYADIIVNNLVILELKAAEAISPVHTTQLINYLKASIIEVGLVLNFGPSYPTVLKGVRKS